MMLSGFGNFYNDLSSDGLFFFWIILFLVVFLIFIAIILIKKNKRLIQLLKEEHTNKSDVLEDNIVKEEVKINEEEIKNVVKEDNYIGIAEENVDNIVKVETTNDEVKENINFESKIPENKEESIKLEKNNNLYQKNVLRELSSKQPTSPIHIEKNDEYIQRESLDNYIFDNGLGMTYESTEISPLEELEECYEETDNMKLVDDIVAKLEKEIKSSNVELTEYERKQEEEAIISYDELEKIKDKIYNITDDEETDEFIDELKSLRIDLE